MCMFGLIFFTCIYLLGSWTKQQNKLTSSRAVAKIIRIKNLSIHAHNDIYISVINFHDHITS